MITLLLGVLCLLLLSIFILGSLFSIPAMLTLPRGVRPQLNDISIDQAIIELRNTGLEGFELIEEVRKLIITRIQYCRRNSFDGFKTAFRRGYGYCVQQAFAMQYILDKLGFKAKVVQAVRNKFMDGRIVSHAWVRIEHNGVTKDIDATYVDLSSDKLTFTPLSQVTEIKGLFKYLTLWGSAPVNAWRYYITGKDHQ